MWYSLRDGDHGELGHHRAHGQPLGAMLCPMATMVIKGVPDDLHRRLRVAAAQRNESIKAIVLRGAEAELDRIEREQIEAERRGKR